jgi:hypothetical protein
MQLTPDVKAQADSLTADGSSLQAILDVHPFHTVRSEHEQTLLSEPRLQSSRKTDFIYGMVAGFLFMLAAPDLVSAQHGPLGSSLSRAH